MQGRIQDFKLGGAHLKKLRRAEGGAKIFGVFRVKNHDFTQTNYIFSNFRGGARRVCPSLDPPLCMAFHPPTTVVVRRQSVITLVFPPLISQWARYSCTMAVKYHNNLTLKQYSQTNTLYAVHRG